MDITTSIVIRLRTLLQTRGELSNKYLNHPFVRNIINIILTILSISLRDEIVK